jgi:hypothetical protein
MTDIKKYIHTKIFDGDGNRDEINVYKINDVFVCTKTFNYPIIEFQNIHSKEIINPIFEKTMSLSDIDITKFTSHENKNIVSDNSEPLFFLCFNLENYYHFIYDTLPYLISYLELKKEIKKLKLLIQNSNLKRFVLETFELLDIKDDDLIKISDSVLYKEIYFSDSFTHGKNSNLPPHKQSYLIYEKLIKSSYKFKNDTVNNPKLYVSRRSWIHGNMENIGTNYTDRRTLLNETDIVNFLKEKDFNEIFTENLTMSEKINLFNSAKIVIGPIGGGLVNCLFSNRNCKLIVLNSPTFFDVNSRFLFSFRNVSTTIYNNSYHVDRGKWKRYQRVYIENDNVIGEIIEINSKKILVNHSKDMISGFSKNSNYEKKWFYKKHCVALDNGLNSPFQINLKIFIKFYEKGNFIISSGMDRHN